jgi:hypothetical protein
LVQGDVKKYLKSQVENLETFFEKDSFFKENSVLDLSNKLNSMPE